MFSNRYVNKNCEIIPGPFWDEVTLMRFTSFFDPGSANQLRAVQFAANYYS